MRQIFGMKLGAMAAAIMLALGGCVDASQHGKPQEGLRFVSLNPCTDAMLLEVADPTQVLALSHYSRDPEASSIDPAVASRFPVTSGTVEEVAALDPDVVLASDFLAPATRNALSDLGYRVEAFGIAGEIGQSFAQIRRMAALAGHKDRGEALVEKIETALASNVAGAGSKPVSTVLWQPGEIVPGEATLASALMRHVGLSSHSAEMGLGQADYLPLERVIASPPQLLLVAGNARGQQHPALARLGQTHVETLDPALLYCAGPTIIHAVGRLGEVRRNLP